ncbi:MAG: acetylxylan esterase [Acidobacteriota bacterium]
MGWQLKALRVVLLAGWPLYTAADHKLPVEEMASLQTEVLPEASREVAPQALADSLRRGIEAANRRSSAAWQGISRRSDWETFAAHRLERLRASLGEFPPPPGRLPVHTTRILAGEGYQIENLVFESRPGLWVTANLYLPDPVPDRMPGILLCHSHHNPKEQGELQDMGMTWARRGCLVLVMDQLGHGERRQHPFRTEADYPDPFPVNRQDYYFRYNTGIQLHVIGDSLMGWMVWDLSRGVDLLLSRRGIDPDKIIVMGSVAGGGDPAAVTAALDPRIAAAVPFNFGGPQPEDPYPLKDNPEESFNFSGSGSWESTRNLRRSCRDGFLPWVIVGAVAPRRLIYAHEFSWDQLHDPVWMRLQRIYGDFYGQTDRLDYTHGFGVLKDRPPQASHCNNIGPIHRQRIHQALRRWFGISENPPEYSNRRSREELTAMTEEVARHLNPKPLHEIASALARQRLARVRATLAELSPTRQEEQLRRMWEDRLGEVLPDAAPAVLMAKPEERQAGLLRVERVLLEVEPHLTVPLLLLRYGASGERRPVVIAVAQAGKARFLKERSQAVAALLEGGAMVCLPDLRGTGEMARGNSRGRTGSDTALSSSELMLGGTLLGARLRDLRSVVRYLNSRSDVARRRLAVWGESLVPPASDSTAAVPLGLAEEPVSSEPGGPLLALFLALYEKNGQAVYARGGLISFDSLLASPFLSVPHDVVIPGALTAGDLSDIAAALAPRSLALTGMVDGQNRPIRQNDLDSTYQSAQRAYRNASAADRLMLAARVDHSFSEARWLLAALGHAGR